MILLHRLESKLGEPTVDLCGLVLAISRIPYGRNSEPTAPAVLEEWRGTCSTKHLLLRDTVEQEWPFHRVELWHRPYTVTRDLALSLWGPPAADAVPQQGLIDVHTFATVEISGSRLRVDVTAPLEDWDGSSDTPLQCGPGPDIPAGSDPLATKRDLVERNCDPDVRESFIAALTASFVLDV